MSRGRQRSICCLPIFYGAELVVSTRKLKFTMLPVWLLRQGQIHNRLFLFDIICSMIDQYMDDEKVAVLMRCEVS